MHLQFKIMICMYDKKRTIMYQLFNITIRTDQINIKTFDTCCTRNMTEKEREDFKQVLVYPISCVDMYTY